MENNILNLIVVFVILQGELEWGIYMNEQQFRVNDLVKFNYSEITEYIDEEHTPTPLRNDDVCELLNEQQSTIESLKEENEELKRKLEHCEHEHFLDSLGSSNKWFGMGGF